jgi:hypothetical protein
MIVAFLLVATAEWARRGASPRCERAVLYGLSAPRQDSPTIRRGFDATSLDVGPRRHLDATAASALRLTRERARAATDRSLSDHRALPDRTFAIFFVVVLPLSWLLQPRPERWRPFIIAASFVFYAGWDWRFCFLLAFSILWNHGLALGIHARSSQRARKQLLVIALAGKLGLLGYFKYYDFFVTSTNNLFALVGLDLPLEARSILLPVGSPSSPSWGSRTSSTSTAATSPRCGSGRSRRTSPSSRTSSPARSCGRAS